MTAATCAFNPDDHTFNVVSRPTDDALEDLSPKAPHDYGEFKHEYLQWLAAMGKNPHRRRGYADTTLEQISLKTDQIFRWYWDSEGYYALDFKPEDAAEFIEFAVDGADRMRDMIQGLLTYSRIETQGDPFESVDLDSVLAEVRTDLKLQIEKNDAEITAKGLPQVEGDVTQLRQVFQNLLDNAIEYSGDEPPRVHVSAERAGDMWEVSVRDEGIGIAPDDYDRVFEVFQSLHPNSDRSGTGIGLALCERIVERHGGEIQLESEPGQGTTFSFTLPVTEEPGN